MKLVIGNKAYSSWSFRPWILMRHLGIPFEEEVVALFQESTGARIGRLGAAGKVPILSDGGLTVWESLAIISHLAYRFPEKGVWPADAPARAHALSASHEMHAGFAALRARCPMNMRRAPKAIALDAAVQADIGRILALWREARERFGAAGPFLYGAFSGADAMYAPVVNRIHAYAIEVPPVARGYVDAVMALPAWRQWQAAALAEPWRHAPYDDVS